MENEKLVNYWYLTVKQKQPTDIERHVTEDTVQYLEDCQVPQKEIVKILRNTKEDILRPESLPNYLWEDKKIQRRDTFTDWNYTVGDNYLKRGEYYYHPALMLRNPAPKIIKGQEISVPYYCEPKIRFELEDLIKYISKESARNYYARGVISSLKHMLATLNKLYPEFESIDIILTSIDLASSSAVKHYITIDDITENIEEAVEELQKVKNNLRALNMNRIVWRSSRWYV